jgi:hypothetical protein
MYRMGYSMYSDFCNEDSDSNENGLEAAKGVFYALLLCIPFWVIFLQFLFNIHTAN